MIFSIPIIYCFSQTKVPPKITPFTFGDEPTNVEDSVSVTCLISSGDLPIDIEWLFNDYGISSFSGMTVYRGGKRTSMLTIESLNSAPIINGENGFTLMRLNKRTSLLNIDSLNAFHRGVYKCIATNEAGTSEYVAELQVNGLSLHKISKYEQIRARLLSILSSPSVVRWCLVLEQYFLSAEYHIYQLNMLVVLSLSLRSNKSR